MNYAAQGGDGTDPVVVRDDTESAMAHAYHLRTAYEFPPLAGALTNLGMVERDLNNLEAARASHVEALRNLRGLAGRWPERALPQLAAVLSNLGIVAEYEGDYESARSLHRDALAPDPPVDEQGKRTHSG